MCDVYRRWTVRGAGALVARTGRTRYSFEFKLSVVRRALDDGMTSEQLAREYELSSGKLVRSWIRAYRRDGEDGLRPKVQERPPQVDAVPTAGEVSDVARLEQENLRLRAEVAT